MPHSLQIRILDMGFGVRSGDTPDSLTITRILTQAKDNSQAEDKTYKWRQVHSNGAGRTVGCEHLDRNSTAERTLILMIRMTTKLIKMDGEKVMTVGI